jgi:hypothetical protein
MPENLMPPAGTAGKVIKSENGWYCFEYSGIDQLIRVWLPAQALNIS